MWQKAARVVMQKAGTCEFIINNAGTNVLESVLVTEEGYEAVMGEPLRADLDLRPGICQLLVWPLEVVVRSWIFNRPNNLNMEAELFDDVVTCG